MAFAFVQDLPVGQDVYDQIVAELALDSPPEGLIVHVAGPTSTGFRIIDVWESEEAFGKFGSERLAPAVEKVAPGSPPPDLDVLPVHHILR